MNKSKPTRATHKASITYARYYYESIYVRLCQANYFTAVIIDLAKHIADK